MVGCCTYEVEAGDPFLGSVPIGKPIANTTLYVLGEDLRKVPPGSSGELYIGGAGVARGYLNSPELTEQRFLTDPFSLEPNARMYKTGDLVRRRETGLLEYLDRLDDQVKVRGYRIELGEIETAIAEHPAVRQSAARMQVDGQGNKRLVGYAVRRENHSVSQGQLREFLRQKLPHYMVPTSVVFLDALPLTLNGKLDRHALPSSTIEDIKNHPPFISARNGVESDLVEIFEELLERENVMVTDSFFDLGMDSLLMVGLLVRIEKVFGKQLSMATLFEAPSISQLTDVVQNQPTTPSEVVPIQPAGSLPPFFCVGAGPLFRPLANHLGTERPFLGLAPTLPEPYQVEDIAAASVKVIREYRREGPYLLGGWSAAGVVAYETARQLQASGHEVSLLVLFDVKNPAPSSQPRGTESREARRQKLRFWAEELRELELRRVPHYVSEKSTELQRKLRQWNNGPVGTGADPVQNAVADYRPRPYPGRVAFFSPGSRPKGPAWDFSQGWRDLVTGRFEAHDVPGNHRSMFSEPNVASLAQKMSTCL